MSPETREMARRQLDRRLASLKAAESLARPPRGWIRAMREALGMTTAQLGRRMGVSQSRIVAIEGAENDKSVTMDTLARAAEALGCELAYVLIPRQSLDTMIEERARRTATRRLAATRHTMALEDQSADAREHAVQVEKLARLLAEKSGSELWEEP